MSTVTANQLTFRRAQTDDGSRIEVYACLVGALPNGINLDGPWTSAVVILDDKEFLSNAINRAKVLIATKMNESAE